MRSNVLLTLLPLLGLIGCVSYPADSSLQFNPDSGNGIIVGSLTKARPGYYSEVEFESIDRKQKALVWMAANAFNFRFGSNGKDFPDDPTIQGTIFAFELPAGEYHFLSWDIQDSDDKNWVIIHPVNPPALPFTVKAGAVTYLGNLFIDPVLGHQGERVVVIDGKATWLDRSERDLPRITKKYPGIPQALIVNETIDGRPWIGLPNGHQLSPLPGTQQGVYRPQPEH